EAACWLPPPRMSIPGPKADMLRRVLSALSMLLLYATGVYVAEQAGEASPGEKSAFVGDSGQKSKKSIVYDNVRYGFKFYLPKSWKGYSIIVGQWEGGLIEE